MRQFANPRLLIKAAVAEFIGRYNFGNQIGLPKLTVEFALCKHLRLYVRYRVLIEQLPKLTLCSVVQFYGKLILDNAVGIV